MIGTGAFGLIDAVDRFDSELEVQFTTYAVYRIRGAIMDGLRAYDWAPRSVRSRERKVRETTAVLEQRLGRSPSEVEEADALSLSLRALRAMKATLATAGMYLVDDWYDVEHPAPSNLEPLENYLEGETRREVREAVESLPSRERAVVLWSYGEAATLAEIGRRLQVTESRVCQIRAQGIRRLRAVLANQGTAHMNCGQPSDRPLA